MLALEEFIYGKNIPVSMASLKDVGERKLIENIRNIIRMSPGSGPGDDAALIPFLSGDIVACTDALTFERHFPKGMSYEDFGWMGAAVNFSDLASMGAEPLALLTAVLMPDDLDESALYDIMMGLDNCADVYGAHIYGGDTKPGPGVLSCTAIGTMNGRAPMLRSGARPGDVIALTGPVGAAAAGFSALENGYGNDVPLSSLMRPVPRVEEGMLLSSSGAVTSCTDLSDGLAEAARSICAASHVGMDIHMDFIPEGDGVELISSNLNIPREDLMLYWGGDYELMFTFNKEKKDLLYDQGLDFSIIGMVTNDDSPYLIQNERREVMGNGRY